MMVDFMTAVGWMKEGDVFEYSVFGSPNQKIGDFVQTKMGDFSC